ncbi:MAG TPA: glycosyltransferase [Chthoniobacterales bacterium]
MPRPSLLIVSHTYLAPENRKKVHMLARQFDVTCAIPDKLVTALNTVLEAEKLPADEGIDLRSLPLVGRSDRTTRFRLRGLDGLFREKEFDAVIAEAEPWSAMRWQAWWWKRRLQPAALFGEFSWENVPRPGLKGAIFRAMYRAAAATSDFAIAGNHGSRTFFLEAGMSSSRVLLAPQLGVDETLFTPVSGETCRSLRQQADLPVDGFLIGFAGRFSAEKGVLDLVAAVQKVRETRPEEPVYLVLLGNGPLKSELEKLHETRPWLHLLPPRDHDEVASFMQMLDVFVLPSKPLTDGKDLWVEQFGHVLIEAMACGVPCVGSSSGEIPVVIGEDGAVFPYSDIPELAGKLEFLLANPLEREALAQRQRDRVLNRYTNAALATIWGDFILSRLDAERKSVLWVDPHLEYRSPSTKHLLYSIPKLKAEGWEIRAWCARNDEPDEMETRYLPMPNWLGPLQLQGFFLIANAYKQWRRLVLGRKPAALVHSIGAFYLGGDLCAVHFLNGVWFRKQFELGIESWKDIPRLGFTLMGWVMDTLQFRHKDCQVFLPVSEGVAGELRRLVHPEARIEVLPNSYDETRFNPEVRGRWRDGMRTELGYLPQHFVFVFASQGHYRRKGFWLAVESLNQVRKNHPDIRFLVVGGSPERLAELRQKLTVVAPDWQNWIYLAGSQSEPEKYLAAADAFLFPSYFEAFCLAEIEAAACGLPLLLTPHHGSEMILQDGVNGLRLSSEPTAMARQIGGLLEKPLPSISAGSGQGLTRTAYASKMELTYARSLRPGETL